ncbi:hypothetical protein PENANT_c333G07204, partial [Penicillium antarcticum]
DSSKETTPVASSSRDSRRRTGSPRSMVSVVRDRQDAGGRRLVNGPRPTAPSSDNRGR